MTKGITAAFLLLMLLMPLASSKPDALQTLLGLPGGEGSISKALIGVVCTVSVVLAMGYVLRRRHRNQL